MDVPKYLGNSENIVNSGFIRFSYYVFTKIMYIT